VLQEPHDDQVERLTRIGLLLCNVVSEGQQFDR
jgi:hypothetical protein